MARNKNHNLSGLSEQVIDNRGKRGQPDYIVKDNNVVDQRVRGLQHDYIVVDDPLAGKYGINLDVMEQTTTDPETGIPNYRKVFTRNEIGKMVVSEKRTSDAFDKKDSDKAMRFNEGKSQLSYILDADVAMKGMCDVFEFGAKKYDRGNWKKGLDEKEIMDSMLRHLTAYNNGEVLDPESGLPHIDHVTCNAIFLATFGKREISKKEAG